VSRKTLTALLALAAMLMAAAPAHAKASQVGIGEQKASMFSDARWQRLGLRNVRYITPWDALRDPFQRQQLDAWMATAHAAHARVLLGFVHSVRSAQLAGTLPTRRQFEREFVRFRERYPFVRDWIPWNEANHPMSLTAKRPRRVARYFDAVARHCRGCNVVAADVLDVRGMPRWVRKFRRAAHYRPRIWGLHNYHDANGLRSDGTRALLAATRGKIWFTETGGLVVRRDYRGGVVTEVQRYSLRHAARATRHALDLTRLSRRIRRIYIYHWQAPPQVTNWDSALIDPRGRSRPAYRTLKRWLHKRPLARR